MSEHCHENGLLSLYYGTVYVNMNMYLVGKRQLYYLLA